MYRQPTISARAARRAPRLHAALALVAALLALLGAAPPAQARPDENLEKLAEALADLATAEPKDAKQDRVKVAEAARALGGGPNVEAAQALVEALDADRKGDQRAASLAGERAEAVIEHVNGKIMKRAAALALLCGARWEKVKELRERRALAAMVAFGVSAESAEGERWLELARAGEAARLVGRAEEAASSWRDSVASAIPAARRREVSAALGRILDEMGRVAEAAQAFQAALDAPEPPPEATRSIGPASGAAGTVLGPEAIDGASLRRARALALERVGDAKGALTALGPAPEGEAADPLGLRGRLEAAVGEDAFSPEALEAQLAKTALHPLARALLAEAAFAKGETRTALDHARVAFAMAPRDPARVALFLRVAAAAGDQSTEGGEWGQAAIWKQTLDAEGQAARAAGLEHPTATALRAAERALAAGDVKRALAMIGEPAELDGEAQLMRLKALEAGGFSNRSKVAKGATALMKRLMVDAPELRALGGTPPPGLASPAPPPKKPVVSSGTHMRSLAEQEFAAPRDGSGVALTFALLGAAVLAGGGALYALRPKPPPPAPSAPPLPVPASSTASVPATRRYEKPKAGAAKAGERKYGPKEIGIGAVSALVLVIALFKLIAAFATPPAIDATVRARLSGDPIRLYARRTEDETVTAVPPGTPLTLGHEFARPPDGSPPRVTVSWKRDGAEGLIFGYVDEKDLAPEDLAEVRRKRAAIKH